MHNVVGSRGFKGGSRGAVLYILQPEQVIKWWKGFEGGSGFGAIDGPWARIPVGQGAPWARLYMQCEDMAIQPMKQLR